MTAWKCKNEDCSKIFYIPARKLLKFKAEFYRDAESVEKACCPHCLSIEFEPITVKLPKFKE